MYEQVLRDLPDSALRLYMCLRDLASVNPSHKLTDRTLASKARIAVEDVAPAQAHLADVGLIEIEKNRIVRVSEVECNVSLTKERDRELETLQAEVEQLRAKLKAFQMGDASGLADVLGPNQAAVVYAAEDVLGRAITYEEAWYLGMMVGEFKSKRVRDVIYSQRKAKNPLKATWAILKNGARGKPFQPKEEEPVEYPKLDGTVTW